MITQLPDNIRGFSALPPEVYWAYSDGRRSVGGGKTIILPSVGDDVPDILDLPAGGKTIILPSVGRKDNADFEFIISRPSGVAASVLVSVRFCTGLKVTTKDSATEPQG